MDKDPSTLLREVKQQTGWSETRLAAEIKASQPTINRILNGQPRCLSTTLSAIVGLHDRHCQHVTEPDCASMAPGPS
jgi:transcriptional regulator with XRE-family HTH domain